MNLTNTGNLSFQTGNYIYTGYYWQNISRNYNKLYNFSSPSNQISNFLAPYSAKLLNGENISGVGQSINSLSALNCISSDRSGNLQFFDSSTLYGTCHGFQEAEKTYYYGWNFYSAFYPQGYYSPNFGENYSIFKANTDGYTNLQNSACTNINITDYNMLFGIPSMTAGNTTISTDTLTPNIYAPIVTPQVICPPPTPITVYFNEINFKQIPGTTSGLGAGTSFNDNPIPTSLDNLSFKINGRYQLITGDPESTPDNPILDVVLQNGRATTTYLNTVPEDKLNNPLCYASIMETSVVASTTLNGQQLVNAPDVLVGSIGSQVVFNDATTPYYWNWIYQENAYSLPFFNYNSNPTNTPGAVGTTLFIPILSSSDYFWKFRQCASTVDFLPWTVGASILACPSEFFEIPYYSAIRKFGFYGTRFLNTCNSLQLSYNIGNVVNASEIDLTSTTQVFPPETEPDDIDQDGEWNFTLYDNLLRVANYEEMYSNMYAGNKGFFLWANSGILLNDPLYSTELINNSGFSNQLQSLFGIFSNIFTGGINTITGTPPNVLLYSNIQNTEYLVTTSGNYSQFLFNNQPYENFKSVAFPLLNNTTDYSNWNSLENKYAYAVVNSDDTINQNFYQSVISGKQQRIRTRYFENLLRGNPIDLYPLNSITFSTDQSSGYIENPYWGRSIQFFGNNSTLPQVNRRYFEGAYGNSSATTNLQTQLNTLVNSQTNFFYPGFFNDLSCTSDTISPRYNIVTGGLILDSSTRSFSTNGWLAAGYNEIGKLNGNFSCFTPIFIQQPLRRVFCKIGQTPTLRSLAVDYHTLPEDKISNQYPEIIYWAFKLKLLDCNNKYLYPMKYQWYRVDKDDYSGFISSPSYYMNLAEAANSTGDWCCLEENESNCTVIHPTECHPVYNTGLTNPSNYTFLKGSQYQEDDQYYYFCMASGRFGIRMSNPTEINIEDWIQFDISVKNGMNLIGNVSVDFIINDYNGNDNTVTVSQLNNKALQNYQGYQFDNLQVPETVVRQKVPPPNAGFGDVTSYTFIGPILYRGELRTFTPSYLNDTRALYETWGALIDYGPLVQLYSDLTQEQGELLYGYQHLPTCTNYQMNNGQKGIQAIFNYNGTKVQQFNITQQAFAALSTSQGTPYNGIGNIGNLYPPVLDPLNFANGFAIGNGWQFAQNLGTIKRFGYNSTASSIETSPDIKLGYSFESNIVPVPSLDQAISYLKTNLLKPDNLAGSNCGYIPYGAGRMMGYYVEAYDSFYILCDELKKKNVQDLNFISPGYRMGNSAIQYNWLGKPYNAYLDRKPLYGPYAYKWRVNRHNRDRNGNGISEGFYSMGYDEEYNLMYDLPTIFGLNVRTPNANPGYQNLISQVNSYRTQFLQNTDLLISDLSSISFGTLIDPTQEGIAYGTIMYACTNQTPFGDSITGLCPYVSTALEVASSPDIEDYSCPSNDLKQGKCFDPCLSIRSAFGYYPGGRGLDFFGSTDTKITTLSTYKNGKLNLNDEPSVLNKNVLFRSSINTPYFYNIQTDDNGKFNEDDGINGLSPCNDGGTETCNFNTPTIFLNNLFSLQGTTFAFNSVSSQIQSLYQQSSQ